MKKVLLLMLALSVCATAADVEGYLIDQMCSAKVVKEGQAAAQKHTRDCALMEPCLASGYGVYTADGKFITFNAAGNKQAEKALRASKQKDNLKVRVSGEVSGQTMTVKSLKLI